jgi:hypothetical protein
MEIVRMAAHESYRRWSIAAALLLSTASGLLGSEIILQKAPLGKKETDGRAPQFGPQATFAFVNYSLKRTHARAEALYVSSGENLSAAAGMIDSQAATPFTFSPNDKRPTALIDLGKNYVLRRLSVIYSPRVGSFDFYVLQSLPAGSRDDVAGVVKLEDSAFTSLRRVGSAIDNGTHGRASIEISATSGRYLMLQWIPAAHSDSPFTIAEVSAVGTGGGPLLASSGRFLGPQPQEQSVTVDAKDIPDVKDVYESKDIPAEAPAPPPPALPDLPPFTFIPIVVPVSE